MAGELEKRVREMMHKMDAKDWDSLNQMATDDLRASTRSRSDGSMVSTRNCAT